MAASPAPRKIALMRKRSTIVAFPPSITRVNVTFRMTPGSAPMSARSCGAKTMPMPPNSRASAAPSRMACTAARAAPSASFSPMRRATMAVAPMLSPIAMA